MVRLWAWEAFAHGAEVVSYFRWRQASVCAGADAYRPAVARQRTRPAYHEASQVATELKAVGLSSTANKGRVAIVFDYQSEWAWDAQPQARGFSHAAHVRALYAAFRRHGLDIDILSPGTTSFDDYVIVAIPALFAWNDALRTAISDFDGHLLIDPRSGSKMQDFAIPAKLAPDLPANLLDLKVIRIDSLDPSLEVEVRGSVAIHHWRERIETKANVVIEDVDGWPVLVNQGKLFYLGGSNTKAPAHRVVDHLIAEADIITLSLPPGSAAAPTMASAFTSTTMPGRPC